MSQPIQLLKQKTDSTLTTLAEHNHDDLYSKLEHDHDDDYSPIDHNHDDAYASTNHTHTELAPLSHNHNDLYAPVSHNHDDLYASTNHNHDNKYATTNHTHDNLYSTINHNHDDRYAQKEHNHDDAYASTNHNHDDTYALKTHNHDNKYPTSENGVLFQPQLGEPILDSQTFTISANGIPTTTVTLPAYSGVTSYTLLTSQDIEAYKNKYAINTDTIKLQSVGFGLSHLHMTVTFSQEDLAQGNDCCLRIKSADVSIAKTETAYATGFLLHSAEPFTVTFSYYKTESNQTGLEIIVELPAATHTIEAGEDYFIDALLPTPPSGWLESVDASLPNVHTGGISHQNHQLLSPVSYAEDGTISLSYEGHYISWETSSDDQSSIKVQ